MSDGLITGSTYLDYLSNADILIYQSINYYMQGYPLDWCRGLYMEAYKLFDGKGVADAHFKDTQNGAHYDNMKLALLIWGARVLEPDPNLVTNLSQMENLLWSAQKTSDSDYGGITSTMNRDGQPTGTANGETTAFTLLAYDDNLAIQNQLKRNQASSQDSLDVEFPAETFSQTNSLVNDLVSIPLLSNWTVTLKNTLQWEQSSGNPRAAIGLFSSLADPGDPSIQIIEYQDGALDVVVHDSEHPDCYKLDTYDMKWTDRLTVSLISDILIISSPAGSYSTSLPSFPLAYVTGGSTESNVCNGGEVNIQVTAETDPMYK